jgi:hypothetical protein
MSPMSPMHDASPWFRLLVAVLATWRLCHLVAHEDGPFDVVVRLRARAGDGLLGRLMDCPYCLSLWLAAPLALLLARRLPDWGAAWLAVSGGACLVEKLFHRTDPPSPPDAAAGVSPLPLPKGAHGHVLLRPETLADDRPEPADGPTAAAPPLHALDP